MRNSDIAISIRDLSKFYGSFQALKGISFNVPRGSFFGFLGPNGAGKTTTINVLTGLSNYNQGSVKVFGFDVTSEYQKTRLLIGLCAQEFNFDPFLPLEQMLIYQAGYFGIPEKQAKKRANELLDRFQLSEKKTMKYRALSGGMKKRLLLCRALVHDPEVLILDEPTAGCDLELRFLIWDYLAQLNKEGKTIFLTTHYMEEAEKLCKTIGIIHDGNIVQIGEKEKVMKEKTLQAVFLEVTNHKKKYVN
ncbi:MAG: ABC transporter ATP-binding protein [Candidatus Omnitrophica bacterium]|nr:ABC transporter ATP-binding protein [Candidatus Omnitrophota bacterium]